ncbi:MAG: DUF4357 domain-containing protein [Kiritimatiellae bacterium]|nr:DUF4357 domain-containing protein [Kiritimatiellia bacterium]
MGKPSKNGECADKIASLKRELDSLEACLLRVREQLNGLEAALAPETPVQIFLFQEFEFRGKNYYGSATPANDGFVVRKGSRTVRKWSVALHPRIRSLGEKLLAEGVVDEDGKFTRDYAFSSATFAAQILCGYSVSGPKVWKMGDVCYGDYRKGLVEE